jgi:hypothetical protein
MIDDPILNPPTDPAGRRLGPASGITPDHLGTPGYEWLDALGVVVASITIVGDRRLDDGTVTPVPQVVAAALLDAVGDLIAKGDLPLGPVKAAAAGEDEPLKLAALLNAIGTCHDPRCDYDHAHELAEVRAGIESSAEPLVMVGQVVTLPGRAGPGILLGGELYAKRPPGGGA